MHIPARLADLLRKDQALDGVVQLSVAQFEPWIKHSHLPFFPEYTDHGIDHLEGVLRTASGLIADEAWAHVTSADAAVLILSVLLHDCALHLSEDGFYALLDKQRGVVPPEMPQDPPWHVLWNDFFAEARRFDGRTLTRLFGDAQPVRRPPPDPRDLTKRDRLLIGEFLRRHHPRLAYEIALTGVPMKGTGLSQAAGNVLLLEGFIGAQSDIARLAGVIARSHGADVRDFLPYLDEHFASREYRGVHPVFLMVVLRVADYLQLSAERAPRQMLKIMRLASPVSQGEWKAHHAIRDIRLTHEDPEAVFVDAFPEDAQTYFRVSAWLEGIQAELDASWAVLGEVYGRYAGLKPLGLVVRRVRSSLDSQEAFAKKVDYVPVRATFRAADADLLKLLIEPLYGSSPEMGVRELIQNSVDAVRELSQYMEDVHEARTAVRSAQRADVDVSIERTPAGIDVVVSDRGIGMTLDVIVNYFLAAGASFRRSDQWRKAFETPDGASKVLRAGRFGVGALASFLIGPEVEVSTRHVEDDRGFAFRAAVDSDAIEIRRCDRPVGTEIRIRASDAAVSSLVGRVERDDIKARADDRWDWYCLATPSVRRTVLGARQSQAFHVPDVGSKLPNEWRRLKHADYADVLWSYTSGPPLACNGIAVRGPNTSERSVPEANWRSRFGLKMPNVVVADPEGRFPLNLARTATAGERYPFDEQLAADVVRDYIAHALVFGPDRLFGSMWDRLREYPGNDRPDWRRAGGRRTEWFFTQDGFGYIDASLLCGEPRVSILKGPFDDPAALVGAPTIVAAASSSAVDDDKWMQTVVELGYMRQEVIWDKDWAFSGEALLSEIPRSGIRILMSKAFRERLSKLSRFLQRTLQEQWTRDGWTLYKIGECPDQQFDFERAAAAERGDGGARLAIVDCYLQSHTMTLSFVAAEWMRILRHREIPYSDAIRRAKLAFAYDELATYIRAHRSESRAMFGSADEIQRKNSRARLK